MTVAPGTIVSDRYRIVEQLGEGGMGAVFRAEHVHMKKMVALKVLLSEVARHPEVVARFEREAVAAGSIDHPNVVTATDFGRLPDGSFFLVMEYVPGRSLRAELAKGPLEPTRALRVARGILGAIEAAHAKNIVHRDLKPENVMLVQRDGDPDFVKVLDFGIAKIDTFAATTDEKPGLTRSGAVMGTPEYMAPEQALGQAVDARSDLYSLGVIFHELLTGKPPFHGAAIVVMRQQVLEAPPPLPDAVLEAMPGIGAILEKLLQKEPQNRYANAKELRVALASLDGAPASSPRLPVAPVSGGISIEVGPDRAVVSKTFSASTDAPTPEAVPATNRKKVVIAGAAVLGLVVGLVAVVGAVSSTGGAKAAPSVHGARATASSIAATTAPPASASASASAAKPLASADETDDDGDGDGDSPSPSTSSSTAPAPRPKPGTASSPRRQTTKQPARKTGPGGIYIPPPSKWFD